jgi:hypothetical protein
MIVGNQPVLVELDSLNCHFYLTGSRFFGNWGDHSDWDFFTEDCQEVKSALRRMGFIHECQPLYSDPLCTSVFVHPSEKIHIQTVSDLTLKIKIQNIIKQHHLIKFCTTKEEQRAMWQAIYVTFKYGSIRT